ncbi:unnamed protein product [Protopolystoma xenopodis]|uniref:Thioredoxin domain-containing protein n=1 Tax=Protopolystoma xenopodis TaxID=117903 RepID=A0A3S5AEZ7_9PLAT|nr:unnamed protein product [Protopolystoma xenopodis]
MPVKQLTNLASFENELKSAHTKNKLLVVDYFANWCGPCLRAAPIFESLSDKYASSNVIFARVDTDLSPDISSKHNISRLPTFKCFENMSCVWTVTGRLWLDLNEVTRLIDESIVEDSVREINTCQDSNARLRALAALKRIAGNIIEHPLEKKYRSINLSNKLFESTLLVVPGAMQFLFSMGFTVLYSFSNFENLDLIFIKFN